MDMASPCPSVCVAEGACGCPESMVIDEEQRRCVMPSQCPDTDNINVHAKFSHNKGLDTNKNQYNYAVRKRYCSKTLL